MPYRDQATVQSWVSEFVDTQQSIAPDVSVLEQNYISGPDSGLVVVSLRTASTVTYIQPVVENDIPRWVVTFEPRSEAFDLDAVGVAKLSTDLRTLADLCEFLQRKTDDARRARLRAVEPAGPPSR
ncbi:protein-L-isoaspartate carboxylmethyltransferase [Microbacterium sp. W1N]|uniref:protein-L-isoaspartate carboxylmethyltransferase n=1 Tax=Microbacterium festucae TaxID=2977531 RepID=UPI0021C0BFD0|nr:protein-L-isoaspartate carboxylmethyltransferase [Microbacterium festucae]MCT9821260.1 protein-L-isoaspartate carboxylmethyltransferase [Microbacterium festucae]